MAADDPKIPFDLSEPRILFEGKWLVAKETKFTNRKTGAIGVWQSAHRTVKSHSTKAKGANVIAILHRGGKKYFILVKQYRIPMNAWCLEFPAGLIEANETAEETAMRELKEETGFVGKRVLNSTCGFQPLDPGLSDDGCQLVTIEVDGDAPENANPTQSLDAAESIQVILVECDKLIQFLKENEEKTSIISMLYSFAIGYSMRS